MASEQSSQPHLPPAWAQTPEPSPSRANDPFSAGGTGPRQPLPPNERPQSPAGATSWKATVPGNGSWQQFFGTQDPAPQGGPAQEDSGVWSPAAATPAVGVPTATAPDRGNGGWGTSPDPAGGPNPFARPEAFPSADPFARPDPFASADPFARPESFPADPFASADPFTRSESAPADPFAKTATFGPPGQVPGDPFGNGGGNGGGNGNGRPGGDHGPHGPVQQGLLRPGQGFPPGHGPADPQPGQGVSGQSGPGHPRPGQNPGQNGPGHNGPGHNGPGQGMPGGPQGQQIAPGGHLSRDPSDPNRPFVTAGQISGPKTPPPERQQELWNTVFGENYQAMGEEDELDEPGKPVWIFALAGSAVIALVGVVLWAFLAGPLASAEESAPAPTPAPSATKKTAKPRTIGRLPRYKGDASPVAGTITDTNAAITVPRLGAPWQQDTRPNLTTTYGFSTRQYAPAGQDASGKAQYAEVMSGPLSPRLKGRYTSPENLAPVINAVTLAARKKFFPEGNTARKTAQQTLSVGGLPAQLAAYEITSGDAKTTVVVAAVSTGADLPSIVYMSVPQDVKELLPDVNTVFKGIKTTAG
ncbi:hypothetical protein ACFFMN_08050 [Planobispora siamensis]|nr:hypothetical protein [Planobispora siamensis]